MREQPLAILGFYVRDSLKEFAEQEIMPPLDGVLGVRAVAGAFFVSKQFRITRIGG